jgi:hypothetical protein
MFTVGAIFGWIAFAIVIALLPGGEFQETIGNYSQILAAYVLLLGAALAYRAAMARIAHDRDDLFYRRTVIAKSLDGEYEARIEMIVSRIVYAGMVLKSEGLTHASFGHAHDQLSPARKRFAEFLPRLWEGLQGADSEAISHLTRRAIRGEAVLRDLSIGLRLVEAGIEHGKNNKGFKEPPDDFLSFLARTINIIQVIDPKLKDLVDRTVIEARDAAPRFADLAMFEPIQS